MAQVLAAAGAPTAPFYVQALTGDRDGTPVPGKMITVQTTDEAVMDRLQEAFTRPPAGSGIPAPLLTAGERPM